MTFVEEYIRQEYGFGQRTIRFVLSDTYEDLFNEDSDFASGDGLPVDLFELDSTSEELDYEDGSFAVDEMKFSASQAACDNENNTNALQFALEAGDVNKNRFCAIFIDADWSSESTLLESLVFIGKIGNKIDGQDVIISGSNYASQIDPIRDYKFSAYSFDISVFDNIKLTEVLEMANGRLIEPIYGYDIEPYSRWSDSVSYSIGDIVTHPVEEGEEIELKYFEAISSTTNNEPPNASYWSELTPSKRLLPDEVGAICKYRLSYSWFAAGMLRHFYLRPQGSLYDMLSLILSKAQVILREITGNSSFTINLVESDLGINIQPVYYDFDSDSYPTLSSTKIADAESHSIRLKLSSTGFNTSEKWSNPYLHRRMILHDEWLYQDDNIAEWYDNHKTTEEKQSFTQYENLSDLLFGIAKAYGCYVKISYTGKNQINIKFVSRNTLVEEDQTYIIDWSDGSLNSSSVVSKGDGEYICRANNYAVDEYDEIAHKTNGEPEISQKLETESAKEKGDKNERLLLSTSWTNNLFRPGVSSIPQGGTVPINICQAINNNPTETLDSHFFEVGHAYYSLEMFTSAITIVCTPYLADQITKLSGHDNYSGYVWRPGSFIKAEINGENQTFISLADYINTIMGRDKQYYESEYSLTVPFWSGFSTDGTDTNASLQNIKLGSKIRITEANRKVWNASTSTWDAVTDIRDFVVVGIERNLEYPETKLKLHNSRRFAISPSFSISTKKTKHESTQGNTSDNIIEYESSSTIQAANAVMLTSTDGQITESLPHSDHYGKTIGVALVSAETGERVGVLTDGIASSTEYSFTTIGAPLYVRIPDTGTMNISETHLDPEDVSVSENMVIKIGTVKTTNSFYIEIDEIIYEE